MNVGFSEAMKADDFTCVIFHDVDLIPEDARNDYGCPSSPRHMSTAVSQMDYKLVLLSMILLVLLTYCLFFFALFEVDSYNLVIHDLLWEALWQPRS